NQIQDQLFQSDLWRDTQTIGVYLSVGNEWDTREIVNRALEEGRDVVIPKTFPDTKEMVFYQITDLKQTVKGPFNLDELDTKQTEPVDKLRLHVVLRSRLCSQEVRRMEINAGGNCTSH